MATAPETYVINLARRSDRLARMSAQMGALGLSFIRIDAVDAASVPDAELAPHFSESPLFGPVPKGDRCCTLSHVRLWETFCATGAPYAVVLEDDVELHPDAPALLSDLDWIPKDVRLIKIERITPRVLVGEARRVAAGTSIAPLLSKHSGSGAYIIERSLARWLLDNVRTWPITIDHMLFNPHVSPIVKTAVPWQLYPVIAWQPNAESDTDIDVWRNSLRRRDFNSMRKSARRAYSDVRAFPRQLFEVLAGRARLVRV
ncbi:MAG: glycosyltransferase family 25 protein [Alphaproteobacteria bacterium]|nr:glycosyltransferase family 25 protein [Alphaproteobacteria bacterium]